MGGGSSHFDYAKQLAEDKNVYSVEVVDPNDEKAPDLGPIRRNAKFKDQLLDGIIDPETKAVTKTIWAAFESSARGRFANNKLFGTRTYKQDKTRGDFVWETYAEAYQNVVTMASGLAFLLNRAGVNPVGSAVGICSANRTEWTEVSLALYSQKMVTVALYDTLGGDAVEYILNHAEVRIAVGSKAKMKNLLGCLPKCSTVKFLIQFDVNAKVGNNDEKVSEEDRKKAQEAGVELYSMSELLELGRANAIPPNPPEPSDVAFIMYTSGTTGVPKGAVLTHGNICSCVGGAVASALAIKDTDVHISFLPLAHIFETVVQVALIAHGASIGFFGGDIKLLTDDFQALKPTVFCGVPRVFTRIHQRVFDNVGQAPCIKRAVFNHAYATQVARVRQGQPVDAGWDRKVFSAVRGRIGMDRVRVIVTGAAPCPSYLKEFLRVVINPQTGLVEGYGMTETSAAVSATSPADHVVGHVGAPLASAEIRLKDVADMEYFAAKGKGEILARGPSIFQGYFKNPEETKKTLLPGGWIGTGDIGRWNPNGTLSIIDRKKNMFKLSQGEYIAAEKIEQGMQRVPIFAQSWVYGNSYRSFIVAVVVPEVNRAVEFLKSNGWWTDTELKVTPTEAFRAEFKKVADAHKAELIAEMRKQIEANRQTAFDGFQSFEIPRDLVLETELDELFQGFNVGNDTMTPTFKLRRPALLQRYKAQLIDLYTKHGEAPGPNENW